MATTTGCGGHHDQPVVEAKAVVALPLPVVAVFRATLRFARRLMLDCCLFLLLKRGMNLVHRIGWIHRIASNSLKNLH